jgi:hypothetical protein
MNYRWVNGSTSSKVSLKFDRWPPGEYSWIDVGIPIRDVLEFHVAQNNPFDPQELVSTCETSSLDKFLNMVGW